MATGVTTRTQWAADLLINYVTAEVQTLEPDLHFANMGLRRDVPKGFDQLVFPQTTQIAQSNVTSNAEGVDPVAFQWGSSSYKAGPTQKGIVVQISDLLVRNSAVETIQACVRQVRYALARNLDSLLQTTFEGVTASGGILYAGGKASRSTLGAGDLADSTLYVKAMKVLRANAVRPVGGANGYYWVISHPDQETDMMLNTSTGSWIDVGRYSSPEQLKQGKMGEFRQGRMLSSANVQTFSSTVTVYPMLFGGEESFGWGYFQQPTPILVTTPDSNNPLNVYASIGAKATLGAVNFETGRTVRLETAVSSATGKTF